MRPIIRAAREQDAAAMLAIYACYIDSGTTFAYALPEEAAFAAGMRAIMQAYPFLALEQRGRLIGYAYAHRYREREAYQWSAEASIYLSPAARGQGHGEALYRCLFELLRPLQVRGVYALVTGENAGSLRFHLRLGFASLGLHPAEGYKAGRWQGMHYLRLPLAPCEGAPAPFRPITGLSQAEIDHCLCSGGLPDGYTYSYQLDEKE